MTPIATIGLHSSASTWVFNIVRELLIAAHGHDQVTACYADDIANLPAERKPHLLVKSHHGSQALEDWLVEHQACLILSIRDPRDCCLSMAKRFSATLDITTRWLANDCDRMIRLADRFYPLLRYEDRFFEHSGTVDQLAARLGVTLDLSITETIFARYQTDAVRQFALNLRTLPPRRLANVGASIMDRVTQVHATHIGDTSSGKWRQLSAPRQLELTKLFQPFLSRFNYDV